MHLLGSSGDAIVNNIFRNLENVDCPGCVHGVYAANGSSGNLIQGNAFTNITGDPVRLRNGTDDNLVEATTFTTSGLPGTNRALVTFWRFTATEVCGTGNRAVDNRYDAGFERDVRVYLGSPGAADRSLRPVHPPRLRPDHVRRVG